MKIKNQNGKSFPKHITYFLDQTVTRDVLKKEPVYTKSKGTVII